MPTACPHLSSPSTAYSLIFIHPMCPAGVFARRFVCPVFARRVFARVADKLDLGPFSTTKFFCTMAPRGALVQIFFVVLNFSTRSVKNCPGTGNRPVAVVKKHAHTNLPHGRFARHPDKPSPFRRTHAPGRMLVRGQCWRVGTG